MIPLCLLCFDNLNFADNVAVKLPDGQPCSFCFGLLNDSSVCEDIVKRATEQLKLNRYDGSTFLLAINTPITMHLREIVVEKLLGDTFVSMSMSPKAQFSTYLMIKISEVTGLRPSLNSDLVLTVTISNNEFINSDMEYFRSNFSRVLNTCKKRRSIEEELTTLFTKVKVNTVAGLMNEDSARRYKMNSPLKKCEVSVRLERDATFIGGRYCKYSRSLPQSPWSPDMETAKVTNNSVSEKIGLIMMKCFRADSYRFIASGREDIDVRMLGNGRPFAIQLINARNVIPLNLSAARKVLDPVLMKINNNSTDIKVNSLARVTQKEMVMLNVGQEEKRKIYSCICYSKVLLTDEMIEKLRISPENSCNNLEISQKTVIRVLKRRPLIDRKRTIFSMKASRLDDYHFVIKLQTQAGTYVKEFVHSDFGRTRPSISTLMGLKLGDVDILELDVEAVDLEWPPLRNN